MSDFDIHGNEFDAWMTDKPNGQARQSAPPAPPHEEAVAVNAKQKAGVSGKNAEKATEAGKPKFKLNKQQKLIAIAGLAVGAIVGYSALSSQKNKAAADNGVSPDVAGVMEAAKSVPEKAEGKQVEKAAAAPVEALSSTETAAVVTAEAQQPAPVAPVAPVQQVAQEPVQKPVDKPAQPEKQSAPVAGDAEKLKAIQSEVETIRAQMRNERQRRIAAEKAAAAKPKKQTVVAVLDDGVVVRDADGNEKVIRVGDGVQK